MSREARHIYRLASLDLGEVNRLLARLADRLDELEGRRGTPEFYSNLDLNGNRATNAGVVNASTDLVRRDEIEAELTAHLEDYDDPHRTTADQVASTATGSLTATNVQNALAELDGDLTAHVTDYNDPHQTTAAQVSSTGYVAGGGRVLTSTSVQSALEELQADIDTMSLRYCYPWEAEWVEGALAVNGACGGGGPSVTWDDLQGDVARLATVGVGVPNLVQVNSTPVYAYEMTNEAVAGNEKRLRASYQMPHRWRPGTQIEIHSHIITGTRVPVSDEYVRVTFTYLWGKYSDQVTGAGTTVTGLIRIPAGTAAYTRLRGEIGRLDGSGMPESSIVSGLIQRTSSNAADTYEDTFYLEWTDIHFPAEKTGTASEAGY